MTCMESFINCYNHSTSFISLKGNDISRIMDVLEHPTVLSFEFKPFGPFSNQWKEQVTHTHTHV